jgi:hypothetical protein
MLSARVLPVVAVQIAPEDPAPALEERLLRACSVGLQRARCVSARDAGAEARAIAVVSWDTSKHVSIEVGLANVAEPIWLSRELDFAAADPVAERWRAVGFTIALLVDDPRFWSKIEAEAEALAEALDAERVESVAPERPVTTADVGAPILLELRALTGAGIVSGPWRWGAELRLAIPLSPVFFVTSSVNYALTADSSLDVRWFDASLGVGVYAGSLLADIDSRIRLELLVENVAVTARLENLTGHQSTWIPGASLGGDLLWAIDEPWVVSTRADVFWLDGSTVVTRVGQRLGATAGAGVMLGLGAGYRF